jgi:NTP pyrophosphatase (non-canonical NTP hydrolase)
MDLDQYQAAARKTDSVPQMRGGDEKLHFLLHGLVDEVGQVASLVKKCMRQDIEISERKQELVSRLGDALWYVSAIATHLDVSLSEIADNNLAFLQERWTKQPVHLFSPQREFLSQEGERFPPRLEFIFERCEEKGIVKMRLATADGLQVGDVVDDNEYKEDFYRFHDVIHIGLMACFRWSPVFRKLLGIKRKSDSTTDRVEDGAKARDIEEAMSRLIFLYFEQNDFLEGATSVDTSFLRLLRLFSGEREIGWVTGKEWQDLMLQTASAIRGMIAASKEGKGGNLIADMDLGTIAFKPND